MDFTPGKPLRAYDINGSWKDYSTDEFIANKLNHLKEWHCSMGVNNLFINSDGLIYGASCYERGNFGNVFEEFELPSDWHVCQKTICSCGGDLFIPKVKDLSQQPLLRRSKCLPTELDKKTDELLNVIGMERVHDSNVKQIQWEIGRRCNYNCSYCWPGIHNNYEEHKSLEQLITATKKIRKQFIGNHKCNFIITGGEPTVNPALIDWVFFLRSSGYHISVHSNGSRKAEYYKKLIFYSDLNLSVHFEYYDKAKFLNVITELTKLKTEHDNKDIGHLEIKIMMTPARREEVISLEKDILDIPNFKEYCILSIVPIKDNVFEKSNGIEKDGLLVEGYVENDTELFGNRNG